MALHSVRSGTAVAAAAAAAACSCGAIAGNGWRLVTATATVGTAVGLSSLELSVPRLIPTVTAKAIAGTARTRNIFGTPARNAGNFNLVSPPWIGLATV